MIRLNRIIGFSLALFVLFFSCRNLDNSQVDSYSICKDSAVVVREAGELESVNSIVISAPGKWDLSYQIVYLPDEGAMVAEGDTVVIFDTKQVELQLEESIKQLESYEQELQGKELSNMLTIQEIKNSMLSLEIQEEINLNRLEQAKYNSDVEQKDAALELEKTRKNIERQSEALQAQYILNRNAENEIKLKIDQTRSKIDLNRKIIQDMFITSPKDGLVVYYKQGRRGRNGEKIKLGDTVRPQSPILKIPDPNNMMVIVDLNEVDHAFVSEGIAAEIVVEAYPDTVFKGHVSYISKIVDYDYSISNTKCYIMNVNIDSRENFRLKPGLSAIVTLFIQQLANSYRIPSWCLFEDDDQYYLISNRSKMYPVDLIMLSHGNAYIKGNFTLNQRFIANNQLSDYE
ncbi:MAG: efflux RND transporter periplasmic adaptor subunit [Candidatus Marinimicrobia bacterium]|nr:efflux RND transporter periplasmic adaptor subunit [Candidatus Neomarinimicrobiota bacterium]